MSTSVDGVWVDINMGGWGGQGWASTSVGGVGWTSTWAGGVGWGGIVMVHGVER